MCVGPLLSSICESTAVHLQRRTEKRSENKEKEKALKVFKDKKPDVLTPAQAPSKPRDTGGYPSDPGHYGPAGFPGKHTAVPEVTLAFLQAEQRMGCHGQEQPPCCTTVLACAGTGTELGIRPDSTALLDEESFQSEP